MTWSGWCGSNTRPPHPECGALPTELHPDAWRRWGSNPLQQRLQGAPAPLAVIPMDRSCASAERDGAGPESVRPAGRTDVSRLLSSQCASTFTPQSGASLGRQDSNLHLHRFWRPALDHLSYVPSVIQLSKRNRPPGHFSWGRCLRLRLIRLHRRHQAQGRAQHRLARESVMLPALNAWRPGVHGASLRG